MPYWSSGVMFGVNMVPNGVAIGRPPANCLPPRTVWQAIQSPARARYSPFLIRSAWSAGVAAIAEPLCRLSLPDQRTGTSAAAAATTTAERANKDLRFIWWSLPALLRFAAARKRSLQRAGRSRHWVLRCLLRGKPRSNGVHVFVGQTRGDGVHAIRRDSVTRART